MKGQKRTRKSHDSIHLFVELQRLEEDSKVSLASNTSVSILAYERPEEDSKISLLGQQWSQKGTRKSRAFRINGSWRDLVIRLDIGNSASNIMCWTHEAMPGHAAACWNHEAWHHGLLRLPNLKLRVSDDTALFGGRCSTV
jgi:hypothetical protein